MRSISMRATLAAVPLFLALAIPAFASDGVLEINQTCAVNGGCFSGDFSGFPVTITTSGSYRLTSNLVIASTTANGITITVDDVSVDLNGFSITGPGSGSGIGIQGAGSRFGFTVENGFVRGMGGDGVQLGRESIVRGVTSADNLGIGINVSNHSVVSGCVVRNNAGDGIDGGGPSTVVGNTVANNGVGVRAFAGTSVIGNSIASSASYGIVGLGLAGYRENVLTFNNGGDANPQVSGGTDLGANLCGSHVCP